MVISQSQALGHLKSTFIKSTDTAGDSRECGVVFFEAYRGLLTLDAAAVEPERGDAVCAALDVEDALVVPLSGLRLRKVLGQQGDGPHDSSRDIYLSRGQDLRALLQMRNI